MIFKNPCVLDGVQWSLDITLTNRRKRTYRGNNQYPPYWEELCRLFGKYSGDFVGKQDSCPLPGNKNTEIL